MNISLGTKETTISKKSWVLLLRNVHANKKIKESHGTKSECMVETEEWGAELVETLQLHYSGSDGKEPGLWKLEKSVLTRMISSKCRLGGEMTLICSSNNKNMHRQTQTCAKTIM